MTVAWMDVGFRLGEGEVSERVDECSGLALTRTHTGTGPQPNLLLQAFVDTPYRPQTDSPHRPPTHHPPDLSPAPLLLSLASDNHKTTTNSLAPSL